MTKKKLPNPEWAQFIIELLNEHDLNQTEASRMLRTVSSANTIKNWAENGKVPINSEVFNDISDTFEIPLEVVLTAAGFRGLGAPPSPESQDIKPLKRVVDVLRSEIEKLDRGQNPPLITRERRKRRRPLVYNPEAPPL